MCNKLINFKKIKLRVNEIPGIKIPDEMWERIKKQIETENKKGKRYFTSPTQFVLNAITYFMGALEEENSKNEQ